MSDHERHWASHMQVLDQYNEQDNYIYFDMDEVQVWLFSEHRNRKKQGGFDGCPLWIEPCDLSFTYKTLTIPTEIVHEWTQSKTDYSDVLGRSYFLPHIVVEGSIIVHYPDGGVYEMEGDEAGRVMLIQYLFENLFVMYNFDCVSNNRPFQLYLGSNYTIRMNAPMVATNLHGRPKNDICRIMAVSLAAYQSYDWASNGGKHRWGDALMYSASAHQGMRKGNYESWKEYDFDMSWLQSEPFIRELYPNIENLTLKNVPFCS